MRSWRKMTWAILIWTGLFAVWGIAGAGSAASNCDGMVGDELAACQAGTAIGAGLGLTFIGFIWFVGFIILAIIWFMTRPKSNVIVYGPQGQAVTVSEAEAQRRIKQGWTYQPGGSTVAAAPTEPPKPTGGGWQQ